MFEQKLFLLDLGERITINLKFSSELKWENCNLVVAFCGTLGRKIAICLQDSTKPQTEKLQFGSSFLWNFR